MTTRDGNDHALFPGQQVAVDGYIRVSRVGGRTGDRFISPTVQRELIEDWAARRGARVLEIFEELDQSGRRADRPLLDKALERVESGISQGIVVSKTDRFGRSLISGLAAIERIRAAGGTFFSIEDGLDTSTDIGRLVLRIVLSLGELESERIRTSWRQTYAKTIARGVHPGPRAPVGYRRTRSGRLRPDPRTADVVAEVFRRRADGETSASLGRWLEAQTILTGGGNPGWSPSAMFGLLRNRVYLGEIHWGPYVNESAHTPLVDAATWQAAQRPTRAIVSHDRDPALLGQLVRCAGCSMMMSPVWRPGQGPLSGLEYTCPRHSAAGRCPSPASIAALYLEPYIEECVFDMLRHRRNAPAAQIMRAEAVLTAASDALARYRDSDRILDALGPQAYTQGHAARRERVRRAALQLAAIRDAHAVHTLPPVGELEDQWIAMDDAARREIIARVIDCVFVSAGHLQVEARVTICPAGTAPQLPRIGDKRIGKARPFLAGARHRSPTLTPWTTERIERELDDFLHGQHAWPSATAFATAGRRRLYDQVVRHAGIACWAHHFGLPILFRCQSREPWTDDRIRAALQLYLRRKRRWPTSTQFRADGLSSLHRGLREAGGVQRWSAELGTPLGPKQRRGLAKTGDSPEPRAAA